MWVIGAELIAAGTEEGRVGYFSHNGLLLKLILGRCHGLFARWRGQTTTSWRAAKWHTGSPSTGTGLSLEIRTVASAGWSDQGRWWISARARPLSA